MSNLTRSEYDLYTSAIVGERLTLVLGRPVVANQHQGAFKWVPQASGGVQFERKPSRLLKALWVVLGAAAIPTSIFAGHWLWSNYAGVRPLGGGTSLPVEVSTKRVNPSVRVSDQEYQPPLPEGQTIGSAQGPLPPMPIPLPVGVAREIEMSAPSATHTPLPTPNTKQTEPKGASNNDENKDKPTALIIDDGPAKKVEAEAKAKVVATPEASKKDAVQPSPKLPEPPAPANQTAKPSTALTAPLTAAKPVQEAAGGQKFAQPVEERSTKVVTSPSASHNDIATKITIVDITPGGKKVLVTNPTTRLPTALAVGDKLPNGKVIQSIDEKSSSITADGTTYKLD